MKALMFSLLLGIYLLFGANLSLACTCVPVTSASQGLEGATAVFSGKVIEIRTHKQSEDIFARVEVVFETERVWKGVVTRRFSVFTSSQSSACGYGFKEGRTYLVYAHGHIGSRLSTSICSRTRRLKDARADLEELGAGRRIEGASK